MNKEIEEFNRKQSEMKLDELLELATNYNSEIHSTGGKTIHMSVPPRITDSDMVIGEVIKRLKQSNETITTLEQRVKELEGKIDINKRESLFTRDEVISMLIEIQNEAMSNGGFYKTAEEVVNSHTSTTTNP